MFVDFLGEMEQDGGVEGGELLLTDALEEAGCAEAAILDHLRGPGPHVRGCHPVDAVLGKT